MLVLDELLSSLDKNGVEFLKTIINLLRDEKSIFIITHHDEIEREFADKEIYVTKEKNITTMEVVYA
jgi:energy-coupling factor transporter ATP-binding protein EcfA2